MSFAALAKPEAATWSPAKAAPRPPVRSSGLRVGEPGDVFEREADRVADRVMTGGSSRGAWSISRMGIDSPLQRKCDCGGIDECASCKEKRMLQRATDSAASPAHQARGMAPASVDRVLAGSGRPLDSAVSADMSQRFGYDFSRVRIHSDAAAGQSARDVQAKAYTVGNNVVFGASQYSPSTGQGQRLIAHELTHVVQQERGQSGGSAVFNAKRSIQRDMADDVFETQVAPGIIDDWNLHLARTPPDYKYVREQIATIDTSFEDNIAAAFIAYHGDAGLDRYASTSDGRAMLDTLYEAIITGSVSESERKQAQRIVVAKEKHLDPKQYKGYIFPLTDPIFGENAVFTATLSGGKVHVTYMTGGLYRDKTFKKEADTLPPKLNHHELLLEPDDVVRIKLYDHGGEIVTISAIELIDFSNQSLETFKGRVATTVELALTLPGAAGAFSGAGLRGLAAAVEAGEASKVAYAAQALVLWADRISLTISIASSVIAANRDWILEEFPEYGGAFLEAMNEVNGFLDKYGRARLGLDAFQFVRHTLTPHLNEWRAHVESDKGLTEQRRATVRGIGDQAEHLLNEDLAPGEAVASVNEHPESHPVKVRDGKRYVDVEGGHEIVEENTPAGIHCKYHSPNTGPELGCPDVLVDGATHGSGDEHHVPAQPSTAMPPRARNVYPEFSRVPEAERETAIAVVARLSREIGIPIPPDVVEAPWIGRIRRSGGRNRSISNSEGFLREEGKFWRQFANDYPEDYALIGAGHTVTPELARKWGWSEELVGDKLIHHHVENGAYVVPVPESRHAGEAGATIHGRVTVH